MRSFSKVLMASVAACALTFGLGPAHLNPFSATPALAQDGGHNGGGSGHAGSGQGGGGQGAGGSSAHGTPGKGLEGHVFEEDEGPSDEARGPRNAGGRDSTGKPATAGTKKGDLVSDLWVILRDENGVPILNEDGFVQPIDADGNLIPLDAEGAPIDESLTQEVELGRTNVARSPTKVIEKSLDEAVSSINAADSVSLDESGRLVLTTDGVEKTIDSPLENLALYEALVSNGTIPGITDPSKLGDLSYLVDGVKTTQDLDASVGFLAGATDKEAPLSVDEIVYLNSILGIPGTITGPDGATYVDYSSFTYDREATYGDMTVQALVETSPGTYETQTVNVYDTVFDSTQATGTAADGYAVAADDARAVLLYVHDNTMD
jgi:hypothetical protein